MKYSGILLIFLMQLLGSSVFAASTLPYDYDANGNMIRGEGKYYEYNDANQLVKIRHNDAGGPVMAEYFYDFNGQRLKKVENGVTTYYIGKHYETQVAGDPQKRTNTSYYFANGERVAKKDASGTVSYFHSDHLGGTNAITDASGNLVERTKYYPFGEVREGGHERYTYTGKEKDKLTDWYYYEARFYNPQIKHFTQADTVAPKIYDPQDLNRYAYVRNNPLKYSDPTGHVWWNPLKWFNGSTLHTDNSNTNSQSQASTKNISANKQQINLFESIVNTNSPFDNLNKNFNNTKQSITKTNETNKKNITNVDVSSPRKKNDETIDGLGKIGLGGLGMYAGVATIVTAGCSTIVACPVAVAVGGGIAIIGGGLSIVSGIGDIAQKETPVIDEMSNHFDTISGANP